MDDRAFPNTFVDYNGQALLDNNGKLLDADKMITAIETQVDRLEEALKSSIDEQDYSVYTGTTGIALLYLKLADVDEKKSSVYMRKALDLVEPSLKRMKRKKLSFLGGDAGPLAVAAVIYAKLGKQTGSQDCLKRLFSRCRDVVDSKDIPDEFLFGRVGYLFSLLYVQHHLGQATVDGSLISKVFSAVIESGQDLSKEERSECPLMYEWHGRKYLGAAHGLAGIFYTLMLAHEMNPHYSSYLEKLVKPSIEYLMKLKFPSGNYPSSIGSSSGDKLVHWCHGAPGWLYVFLLAYKIFEDERYKEAALSCGEVLWERGLLKKGYGICHGVTGNAYGFLALYRLTRDMKHLHRAVKFAEWSLDHGKHGCRTPDRPYSLYEGLAGVIYFWADLLNPLNSRFPAFEL